MTKFTSTALIVEPNQKLTHPYKLLSEQYHITRVSTITDAESFLENEMPNLIMLSASFSAEEQHAFLENVTTYVKTTLPKLVMVIDLNHPINTVLGTTWGKTLEVVTSNVHSFPKSMQQNESLPQD